MIRRSVLCKTRGLVSKRSLAAIGIHIDAKGKAKASTESNISTYSDSLSSNQFISEFLASNRPSIYNEPRRSFSSSPRPSDSLTKQDFFGERITFLEAAHHVDATMPAYDTFLLAVLTRGKSAAGGGSEEGLQIKAAHSAAIAWAELLETAHAAPMMAVVAVGPILVQADVTYVRRVDELLQSTRDKVQLMDLATKAISKKDHVELTQREQFHLQALHLLMEHKRTDALKVYLSLLQMCPGDALALSFAIDLASTLGNKDAALRAATSVYSYWQDRQSIIPGYSIGASLIAVGLAAGGRFDAAEGLLQRSASQIDLEGCAGVASWAWASVFDAEGRVAEGISGLNGYDGVSNFDSAGLLFFDSRLCGYGARFALDREGVRSARSILRVYDESYSRVFLDSGYAQRTPSTTTERRAPTYASQRFLEPTTSLFQNLFGSSSKEEETQKEEKPVGGIALPTSVDTLTWLPPTPQLLTDATFLLLRITLHGSIDGSDHRWQQLQNTWLTLLDQYGDNYSSLPQSARVAASLVCHDGEALKFETVCNSVSGAVQLGSLMWLGESKPTVESTAEEWKKAVLLLSDANYAAWDIDARPLFEIAVCEAACMTENDLESLSIARSVSSRGVALRTNSPEEWSRYSKVLEKLGDEVAADKAKAASISMGAGEGGYGVH